MSLSSPKIHVTEKELPRLWFGSFAPLWSGFFPSSSGGLLEGLQKLCFWGCGRKLRFFLSWVWDLLDLPFVFWSYCLFGKGRSSITWTCTTVDSFPLQMFYVAAFKGGFACISSKWRIASQAAFKRNKLLESWQKDKYCLNYSLRKTRCCSSLKFFARKHLINSNILPT